MSADRTGLVVEQIDAAGTRGSSMTPRSRFAADHHGDLRRKQGYTVAMVVDESGVLQVCIVTTLHRNTNRVKLGKLLPEVVINADEVDAQFKQQMLCFMAADAAEKATKVN